MRIPEKFLCDMCGKEIDSVSGYLNQKMPVVTKCEWEEGHATDPQVTTNEMDLCRECYINAFNIECGYRGSEPKFIR